MERNLNLMHVIILGFAILSLIFLISGFATRGWIIYEMTIATNPGEVPYHDWKQHPEQKANLKFTITFGLWKGKACVMSKCTDLSYSQTAGIIFYDKVAHEFPWTRYKVVGTFSLILGILSMLFTLAHVRTNNCPSGVVTLITWTSTGGLFFYLVGKFAKVTENMNSEFSVFYYKYANANIDTDTPYSVVLIGLGCIAAFTTAFMVLVNVICCGQGKSRRVLLFGRTAAAMTAMSGTAAPTATTSATSILRF